MKRIWIRRDRGGAYLTEVDEDFVRARVVDIYQDVELALKSATVNSPLTTGFADYYPKVS